MEVAKYMVSSSAFCFEDVLKKREPAVLRGLDLGTATDLWTPEYLGHRVGSQAVKVHVSPDPCMNFLTKNFVYRQVTRRNSLHDSDSLYLYRSLPFEEFVLRSSRRKNVDFFLAPVYCSLTSLCVFWYI